jgi:hypothetical protein
MPATIVESVQVILDEISYLPLEKGERDVNPHVDDESLALALNNRLSACPN